MQLGVDVFSTAPQSADVPAARYFQNVVDVARWSEDAGCRGILVYTDNRLVDPWLVAQLIVENTRTLCPLVAVQPVYMHPYAVATMVASFAYIHSRRVYLNMVAGGFKNDLVALSDDTPHDQRYERIHEYTTVILELLRNKTLNFKGKFYQVHSLKMAPPMSQELFPGVFMSGSSDAGMATARALGVTAVEYPKPSEEYSEASAAERSDSGIRLGVVTEADKEEAWAVARRRFPSDPKGQLTHKVAMKVSDSHWHKQLSDLERETGNGESLYWLWPFKNYQTFCPYLVGSHEDVSRELARYIRAGFQNFILDIPAAQRDLHSSGIVFRMAVDKAAASREQG